MNTAEVTNEQLVELYGSGLSFEGVAKAVGTLNAHQVSNRLHTEAAFGNVVIRAARDHWHRRSTKSARPKKARVAGPPELVAVTWAVQCLDLPIDVARRHVGRMMQPAAWQVLARLKGGAA